MKFYQKLSQHPKVRDAVEFLNRLSSPAPTAADSTVKASGPFAKARAGVKTIVAVDPRKAFRAVVAAEILEPNAQWKPLAASLDERLPDPLAHPELVAYGAALLEVAKEFEVAQDCSRECFLTDNERRACELSTTMGELEDALEEHVRSFAADMNLAPHGADVAHDPGGPYHALRLLAFYRVATGDQQNRIFELSGYGAEKRLGLMAELLSYMELGFSRTEAVEYLRRRGFVPAALAQQALAKNVLAEGYVSSEASSDEFVRALRSAYVPDDVIRQAWESGGFDPALIELALLAPY